MIVVRVVLAAALTFAAIAFAQRKGNHPQDRSSDEPAEEETGKDIYTYAVACANSKKKEEEVMGGTACNPALSGKSFQESDQLLLPEFDDLLNVDVNFPSDSEKSRLKYDSDDSIESKRYESNTEDDEALEIFEAFTEFAKENLQPTYDGSNETIDIISAPNNTCRELAQLRTFVEDLQEKEMKLEVELLEFYGLKEQRKNELELENKLKQKIKEIERLNAELLFLQEQSRKLFEELEGKESMKDELKATHTKIREMQKARHIDASETKAQLLTLKQQVALFQEREQEASKRDFDIELKLQTLKELEVEVMEVRRTMKDLQHQKRDLTFKLTVAETKLSELSSKTESEKVAQMRAQASSLRQANEDLIKQVEGLQMNRFSEVEELVYLRWVNACLRYQLRNFQAPPGKLTALDLGKSLSPKSQEKAKQLMMEYAGPYLLAPRSREHSEQEYDSISSFPSTPSDGDFDDSSLDGHLPHQLSNKKLGLFKKLKRWGRRKEDNKVSPPSSSESRSSVAPGHRRTWSKGSLESLILHDTNESLAITAFGTNEFDIDVDSLAISNFGTNEFDISVNFISKGTSTPCVEPQLARSRSFSDANDVSGPLNEKYPAFKDRHKLALAREEDLKDRAERARAEKFGQKLKSEGDPSIKSDKTGPRMLNTDVLPQVGRGVVLTTEHKSVHTVIDKIKLSEVQKRAPRIPKPVPKSSANGSSPSNAQDSLPRVSAGLHLPPPPPPPPLPPTRAWVALPPLPPPGNLKSQRTGGGQVQRAPEVVEFYQSLMRREAKKDTNLRGMESNSSDAHNMIGEIENRSAFLLAVKADVETQGDFVLSLASEVRDAAYTDIEDVIAFVAWLDDELAFLVDERAVLKHFDWPENKADAIREAAFEYQDLKRLENEVSLFEDNARLSCDLSLKKMLDLLEKVEQNVYALLRSRDMAIARYKEFNIPTYWMLDSGLVGKIKLGIVHLARKYMKRVASELDLSSSIKELHREFLLLQGVRFAFRVHQFTGGFDAESMCAFEELRDRVRTQTMKNSTSRESQAI